MNYLLFSAVIPVILLLIFIYKKDPHKEPNNMLAKTFLLGLLSAIPTMIAEIILSIFFTTDSYSSLFSLFISVFCSVAIVEEFFKWIVLKILVYNHLNFDESYDAIVYAVFSSLGFACIENILYVASNGFTVAILRALTAIPGHACFGIIMGFCLAKAKNFRTKHNYAKANFFLMLSILIPTLIHTIYDFLVFSKVGLLIVLWLLFDIVLFIICFIIVSISAKENKYFNEERNDNYNLNNNVSPYSFCSNCGKKLTFELYCPDCGKKKN